jgi:hypothetical protein
MAMSESIARAADGLHEALVRAELIVQALEAVSETPPGWVYLFRGQVEAIIAESVGLVELLRLQVIPSLDRAAL